MAAIRIMHIDFGILTTEAINVMHRWRPIVVISSSSTVANIFAGINRRHGCYFVDMHLSGYIPIKMEISYFLSRIAPSPNRIMKQKAYQSYYITTNSRHKEDSSSTFWTKVQSIWQRRYWCRFGMLLSEELLPHFWYRAREGNFPPGTDKHFWKPL